MDDEASHLREALKQLQEKLDATTAQKEALKAALQAALKFPCNCPACIIATAWVAL